jgi:hypothetical protein
LLLDERPEELLAEAETAAAAAADEEAAAEVAEATAGCPPAICLGGSDSEVVSVVVMAEEVWLAMMSWSVSRDAFEALVPREFRPSEAGKQGQGFEAVLPLACAAEKEEGSRSRYS